jgi:hypothetical protein
MKAKIVGTGEVFDYIPTNVEGIKTVLLIRKYGFAKYYEYDVIDVGVKEGWLELVEEVEDEQEGNGMV